jgi:hypothetical protein
MKHIFFIALFATLFGYSTGIQAQSTLVKINPELSLSQYISQIKGMKSLDLGKEASNRLAQAKGKDAVAFERKDAGGKSLVLYNISDGSVLYMGFSPSIPSGISTLSLTVSEAAACYQSTTTNGSTNWPFYENCIKAETNDHNNTPG